MKSVTVARLKDHLSRYLQEVTRGEEVIIRNRNKPIARIVPISSEENPDRDEERLVAEGKLSLPSKEMNRTFWKHFWTSPGAKVSLKKAAQSVVDDRNEG